MVRRDIIDIVQDLGLLFENQVGMTTNGSLLSRRLPKLFDAGLSHLNISLDSLVPVKNEFMTRRPDTSKVVLKALDQAFEIGFAKGNVKLNVVAMKGFNCDEFADFAALTKEMPVDVRFIEFMPFADNDWSTKKFIPMDEILAKIR